MTTVRETDQGWVPSADTFGARLALVRQHLGLNVKAAAERAGLDHSSWGTWERGRQPRDMVDKARQISGALGCDFIWLLTGSAEPSASIRRYLRRYVYPGHLGVQAGLAAASGFVPAA
jgi:transcriptional regulator with XRE-family HTH domain